MFQTVFSKLAATGAFLALAASAGVAQARDVSWSIGIGVPGVVVGVGDNYGYSGYRAPAPVYYAPPPPPVYYAPPRPVYYAPPRPVYYAPPVVYSPPPPVYYGGSYYRGNGHYDRGHRRARHDRHDRRGRDHDNWRR